MILYIEYLWDLIVGTKVVSLITKYPKIPQKVHFLLKIGALLTTIYKFSLGKSGFSKRAFELLNIWKSRRERRPSWTSERWGLFEDLITATIERPKITSSWISEHLNTRHMAEYLFLPPVLLGLTDLSIDMYRYISSHIFWYSWQYIST